MKKIFVVIVLFLYVCVQSSVFALTPKEQKGVKVLKSPALVYEQPDRATPFPLDKAPDTIKYRKSILPYEQDKDADMYSVIPTLGIVTPVIFIPEGSNDYNVMSKGGQIDINKYLVRGVLQYPRSGIPGEEGNPVIFGHSNFYKNGTGDYRTIYADIMNLDADPHDELWFFVKQKNGEYDLRKFSIEKSYETVPTDVGVMKPRGGKEVTMFACTNGLAGRWILKGRYIEKDETLIPYPLKWEMLDLLEKLKSFDKDHKEQIIQTVLTKIDTVKKNIPNHDSTYHDKFKRYVLNRIEKKLVELY